MFGWPVHFLHGERAGEGQHSRVEGAHLVNKAGLQLGVRLGKLSVCHHRRLSGALGD